MQYRELGSTGIRVSLVGLGAVKFGRNEGLSYPVASTLPAMRALKELLAVASDLGINLIDTAPAYGTSEERLGQLLAGRRNDWVVCTKVGETFEGGRSHYDFSPEQTRRSVLRSLQRLATNHLDVVLIHSDGNDIDIIDERGTLQALADMKHEGLIRAFGMSHKTLAGGLRAVDVCDVVMTTLNTTDREALGVVERAHARSCGVLIKKALASGEVAHDPVRRRASLQFVARTRGVSSIVVGTTDVVHLRENVAALEHLPDSV
jgi:aryl-alcohol dehydrogenase-like predicted oxidoreductase